MRHSAFTLLVVLLAVAPLSGQAALSVDSGGSVQPSFFVGATGTYASFPAGAGGTPLYLVEGRASRDWNGMAELSWNWLAPDYPSLNGYLQATATAPFTAGALIHVTKHDGGGLAGDFPYTITLDGTMVDSSPGDTTISDLYEITRFAPVTASALRVTFSSLASQSLGNYSGVDYYRRFAGVSEVLLLPALGDQVPISGDGCAATATLWGEDPRFAVDGKQGRGWFGDTGATLTMNLGDPSSASDGFDIASVLLAGYEGAGLAAAFSVWGSTDGGGAYTQILGNVQLNDASFGMINLSNVAGGVTHLQLRNNPGQQSGPIEFMAFGPIPEPASLALLAIGALALLKRQRKP